MVKTLGIQEGSGKRDWVLRLVLGQGESLKIGLRGLVSALGFPCCVHYCRNVVDKRGLPCPRVFGGSMVLEVMR